MVKEGTAVTEAMVVLEAKAVTEATVVLAVTKRDDAVYAVNIIKGR